jgi:hypothetical protein
MTIARHVRPAWPALLTDRWHTWRLFRAWWRALDAARGWQAD